MGQTAKVTRKNRTITVDFHHEATCDQLLDTTKAFVEFVLAFLLALGFQLGWSKYPNALLCPKLRPYHTARFILNFTALLPILIIHESRLGKDERGMDWKTLLGSITTSGDEELQEDVSKVLMCYSL
jgi:hypothetical protein